MIFKILLYLYLYLSGILVSEHDSEIHKGIVHSIRQDLVSNSEIN